MIYLFFREEKYDRQMFGTINRYYTLHLTWSVLITITCNIWIEVVAASPGNVQTMPRNQARKNNKLKQICSMKTQT
jgi:hypothetical protein